jgi:hypothetical protein
MTSPSTTMRAVRLAGPGPVGNLRLTTPGKVYAGRSATITASWSDLASGKRYLGGAQFLNPAGAVAATTALLVETNDPLPLALPGPRARSAGTQ